MSRLAINSEGNLSVIKDILRFRIMKNESMEISRRVEMPINGKLDDEDFCLDVAVVAIESNYGNDPLLNPYGLN